MTEVILLGMISLILLIEMNIVLYYNSKQKKTE